MYKYIFAFSNFQDSIIITSMHIYESIIFQILVSILCINKYLLSPLNENLKHNIVYKKIIPSISLNYNINGTNYYVPTYGYLIMYVNYSSIVHTSKLFEQNKDKNINFNLQSICEIHRITLKYILLNKNIVSINNLLDEFGESNKENKQKLVDYIKNKKIKKSYTKNILFKKCISYIFVNKLLNFEKYTKKSIIDMLYKYDNLITSIIKDSENNMSIEDIFDKYFSSFKKEIPTVKTFTI